MTDASRELGRESPEHYMLPKPEFNIGDRVEISFSGPVAEENKAYLQKSLVRHEIRSIRRFRNKRPMHPYNKDQIREKLRGMREAFHIEVAGVMPTMGHNVGSVSHQSYLPGVPGAASPLVYGYTLCFRWLGEQGQVLAYVPRECLFFSGSLKLTATAAE